MLPWAHDSRVPYNTGDRKQIHIPHHLRRLKDGLVCTDKPGVSPKDKIEPASKRAASALTHGLSWADIVTQSEGHMPRLRGWSLVGAQKEATEGCFPLTSVFLSHALTLSVSLCRSLSNQ